MGLRSKMKPVVRADTTLMQTLDFRHQPGRFHHCPACDQAGNPGAKDSRWDQVQDIFLPSDFHGVPGVVAPLGTKYPVGLPGHDIKDFSLPFISPLETENHRDVELQGGYQPEE